MPIVTAYRLGRVEYADGLELQRQFQAARKVNAVSDTLLLLQHPAVLTLGRAAKAANVLKSPHDLDQLGVGVFETDRGGDVTYHGPGQLVGYPLLHLPPGRQDVRKYVRAIEEVIIRVLRDFDVEATRIERWPGVWVEQSRLGGPRKICALGVHLSRWYTRHGFALNVDPDLSHFELIVPCGITEAGVTSMARELGTAPRMEDVEQRVLHHFGQVFEAGVIPGPQPASTVSVTVTEPSGRSVLLLERTQARGGFWQPVTGRVEAGEAVEHAAARELLEETGLSLEVTAIDEPHVFAWGELVVAPRIAREFPFLASASSSAAITLDRAEHDRFEWVPVDEALRRVPFEGLKRSIRTAWGR